jgi:hypothetical protein
MWGIACASRYNLEFRPLLLHVQSPYWAMRATLSGEWYRGGIPGRITLLIEGASSPEGFTFVKDWIAAEEMCLMLRAIILVICAVTPLLPPAKGERYVARHVNRDDL